MNTKKDNSINIPGALVWVPLNPTWQNMVLGGRVLIQTYTLCNVGDKPVTIQSIGFTPGGDTRLRITGGTCGKGVVLAPKARSTLHVEMDPRTLGQVDQFLHIQHTGSGLPLRSRLVFSVVARLGRPTGSRKSFLVDDTPSMDRARRLAEQDGHRRLAKVHAREHNEGLQQQPAPEGELQNNILQNPWLDSQRFDGVDTNLNPAPSMNPEAGREFESERQQQEMEKQLKLGNAPKFTNAPKPQGLF